jgi:hypothetical protein
MSKRERPREIAAELEVQQRVLLFCLASGPARFKLTPLGRDVLTALLKQPVDEQDG